MTGGCSSDDSSTEGPVPPSDEKVAVQLHIAPAGSATGMRAWEDTHATDDEMMNIWTVVITTDADAVEKVIACKPTGTEREIDPIVELPAGTHHFYSFANMSVATIAETLGITVTMPAMTNNDEVYEATAVSGTVNANKNVTVNGNKFAALTSSDDNGFGSYGIPMSNRQTATITGSTTLDLIVIRMLAKIELQFYNDTGSDVTVTGITLTDVTANAANNLKLLPSLTAGANTMNPVHGDIQPNLNGTPATGNVTYTGLTKGVSATTNNPDGGTPVTFTFYVNESTAPAVTSSNVFGHYFLTVTLNGETEARYALIDDTNANPLDGGRWDYIARNDYRIIPIVLDDYKLDIIPYDFPAIGVYPASVKEEDGYYTINFHDYGHFHLVPKVTKISTSVVVPFAATAPTGTYASTSWGLVNDTFTDSWGSWTDVTKATQYVNEEATTPFYRTGYTTDPPLDGDEVGGEPVWYPNTSAPQWDPAGGSTYNPFIFGYIADPGAALAADRKVYHEFSVNLYKQGMTAPRVMTYRLYMILDTDQMMYSRMLGAPRVRPSHDFE
jgi:hypothetical protein